MRNRPRSAILPAITAAMELGDVLTYDGRTYVLLGMEPMSVPDRKAELRDTRTGEIVSVPCSNLAQSSEGFGQDP